MQGMLCAFITGDFNHKEVTLQPNDYTAIEASVSSIRLKTYKTLTRNGTIEECIGAYLWNKRVGAALFPLMQCLEVSLRNAIHASAARHFGTPDWFDRLTKLAGNDYYLAFINKKPQLAPDFYRNGLSSGSRKNKKIWLSRHENMLVQAKKKLKDAGKPLAADAIIAELMLGFWVGLFERNYFQLNSTTRLWPHLESIVFPNLLPSQRRYGAIYQIFHPVKEIRNRLAHHEPLWKHTSVSSAAAAINRLTEIINNILMLIRGLSSERADLLYETGLEGIARKVCCQEMLDADLSILRNQRALHDALNLLHH